MKNVTIKDDAIGDVRLSGLRDIVLKGDNASVSGRKIFAGGLRGKGDVEITSDRINGFDVMKDFVRQGVAQNITARKLFQRGVHVIGHLNTGTPIFSFILLEAAG